MLPAKLNGTELADQEQNRQTRYANRKPEPARERNEPATVGTEHNCNRQTRNGTGKPGTEQTNSKRNRQTRNKTGKSGTQTGNPNRHAN